MVPVLQPLDQQGHLGLADFSYHTPDAFRIDESTMSDAQRAGIAANRAALRTYGGGMTDPSLRERLAGVTVPALVVWGESDRVVPPDYGRAFAAAIPGAHFELLPGTGHVPQIETPELLLRTLGKEVQS
jgi:pimeloyl-ACP methyl ester carboxylesterase